VFVIFNVVIGGIGSFEGPIIGAGVYFVLRQYLGELGTWNLILLGTLSIALILVEKHGLWGLCRRFLLAEDLIPIAHRPAAHWLEHAAAQDGSNWGDPVKRTRTG
jgi:branched-chain amino acid transport system permease protein